MPYLVNGQVVPEQVIREEYNRIARDPSWQRMPDGPERAHRLRRAAEASAADRVLIEQQVAHYLADYQGHYVQNGLYVQYNRNNTTGAAPSQQVFLATQYAYNNYYNFLGTPQGHYSNNTGGNVC